MIRRLLQLDGVVLAVFVLLFSVSLIALYSMFSHQDGLSPFFVRQSIFISIGMLLALTIGIMNYNILSAYATPLYFVMIALLASVLIFGGVVRGTVGWITIGSINIQPVEIVKIFLIIFLASFIAVKRALLGEVMTIIVSFGLVSVIIGLILMQPDTGSALVVLAIWLGMIIVSGIRKRYIAGFVLLGVIIAMLAWMILAPYQRARITNFLHPENDPHNTGYNVIQSMVAVGNGGLTGQGIGAGTQSQLNFLPEKHTDFIFASFTEAMGFVGAFFILGLFFVLFVRMRSIALRAYNEFGYFLIVGLTILLFVHMLVNIGMNVGIMPVTGIPLPFVSYGGSAIVSMSIGIGIVLAVYRLRKQARDAFVQESY